MSSKLLLITSKPSEAIREYCEEWTEDILYVAVEKAAIDLTALCEENWGIFVVCKEEREAAQIAACIKASPELNEKIICLEGYEGKHYFDNCIQTKQDLDESLFLILDMAFLPGAINLDYVDLKCVAKGLGHIFTSFSGSVESVKEQIRVFLQESGATFCMLNIFGDVELSDVVGIAELFEGYEQLLFGVTLLETEKREVQVSIIYDI